MLTRISSVRSVQRSLARSLSTSPRQPVAISSSRLPNHAKSSRSIPTIHHRQQPSRRTLFSFLKRKSTNPEPIPVAPILTPDNLFHPLSQSPISALRAKATRIKSLSLCPVSLERYGEKIHPAFDCPNCGFPTHATRERWEEGKAEHDQVCGRLREVNEDEHDLRSGRRMTEFENMPGPQPYESSVSFQSWDTLFFTRNFVSIDSDRAIRHISKLLTYPITIAGVLHQNGPYTSGNGRITREGRRSMAAVHSILHLPPGSTSTTPTLTPQPPFRLFLLGARAESTLPPAMWEQLSHLFPRTTFHIYFIGPEVGIPLLERNSSLQKHAHKSDDGVGDGTPSHPPTAESQSLINEAEAETEVEAETPKSVGGPRGASGRGTTTFTEEGGWGVPSYTINVSPQLTLTSLKAPYQEMHHQLGPFDPYTDVFFAFSPGLGFPSQPNAEPALTSTSTSSSVPSALEEGETTLDRGADLKSGEAGSTAAGAADSYSPKEVDETLPETTTQPQQQQQQPSVQAQTTWRQPLQQILKTKCALFFTAFSPTDLARDVSALSGSSPVPAISSPPPSPSPSPSPADDSASLPSATQTGPSEFPSNIFMPTLNTPIEGITDEYELVLTPGKNWFGSEKWEIAEWDSRVGVKTNWGVWGIRGKKYEVVKEGEEDV